MRRNIVFLIIFILSLAAVYYSLHPPGVRVQVGSTVFSVDVAATELEKEKGLGYRDTLADKHGMLFIYDHKEQYGFWMKGMRFPLDFIWIDGNKVVDLTEHVQTADAPPYNAIQPMVSVDRILEVPDGTIARFGIKIGDPVIYATK